MATTRVTEHRVKADAQTQTAAAGVSGSNDVRLVISEGKVSVRPVSQRVVASTRTSQAKVSIEPPTTVRVVAQTRQSSMRHAAVGAQGPPGDQQLHIGPTEPGPGDTPPWLWVQTLPDGSPLTIWIRTP